MLLSLKLHSDYVIYSICFVCVIYVSNYICSSLHLYTVLICADGAYINMFQCIVLATKCVVCYWLSVY